MASLDDNEVKTTLGDDELQAGSLMTHWKHEHHQTMWNDLTDKTISKTQLRLATILCFVMLLFKIGLVLLEAYSPVDVYMMQASWPLAVFMILFIWAAALSQKHPWQNKVAILLIVSSDMWYYFIMRFVNYNKLDSDFMFVLMIFVVPVALYIGLRHIANAVRLGHTRKEIIQISTSLVTKIVGSMPLFFYLILGLISKTFAIQKAEGYICDLLPNAYLEHDVSVPGKINLQSVWRNCSIYDSSSSGYMYNETMDPSSFTVRDVEMKRALIKKTALFAFKLAQMFQAIEVTLFFLTSVILVRVRKKSIKDIFNLKITFSELL